MGDRDPIFTYERTDVRSVDGLRNTEYIMGSGVYGDTERMARDLVGTVFRGGPDNYSCDSVILYRADRQQVVNLEGEALMKVVEHMPRIRVTREKSFVVGSTGEKDDLLDIQKYVTAQLISRGVSIPA